ncbi:MAG TPA: OmpA family protein [Thermoanaerobaculia bacterium]|nr:OmpA family protein [Thermoanaerobaculia bacterium]
MKKLIATLMAVMFAAAPLFAQTANNNAKTKKGAVIGGVAGAIAGALIGRHKGHTTTRGAVVGGVVGAAAGAIVGHMMDKQEQQLRQIQGVDVTRTAPDQLNVTVQNQVLFDFDSAALRPESRDALQQMASVFKQYPNETLQIEGFTDSIGSASYNQRLSVRRADSVADYLETIGVDGAQMQTLGFGESQPVATNSTPSGRQQNRRVEIHVRANA